MLHTITITRKSQNRKGQALSAHEVQCDCHANTEMKTLAGAIEWTAAHFGIDINEFAKGTVTRVGTNGYKYSREV